MKMSKMVVLGVVLAAMLSSCGMSWQRTIKDFKSDYDGGLPRNIVVQNMYTGAKEFEYDGLAYITDDSKAGDFTIVCNTPQGLKKVDFLGDWYGLKSVEK